MENLINKLNQDTQIIIKTWYSIKEDKTTSYIKCELNKDKVLVIIPDDKLIYIRKSD